MWVNKRKSGRALVEMKYGEDNFQEATDHLNKEWGSFGTRSGKYLTFNVNAQQLKDKPDIHEWLALRLSPKNLRKNGLVAAMPG